MQKRIRKNERGTENFPIENDPLIKKTQGLIPHLK